MSVINLNRLAYFAAVVDTGSFTRAAERLGITKAVVSQQVARLEDEMKVNLLLRTTRRVVATDAGRLLHLRCEAILKEAEAAFEELAQTRASPMGVLRVAAPNDYGAISVAPVVAEFCQTYPDCRVELILSDAKADLVAEEIDVAIRVGWLVDSALHARKLRSFHQILVASAKFSRDWPVACPEDLTPLPFIANGALKEPLVLRLAHQDQPRKELRLRPAMTMNSTTATLHAALADGGMAVLPDFLATPQVAAGRLVHLLPDWQLPTGGIHVVFPATRFRPPKVARFVDLLAKNRLSAVE